MDHSVHPSPTVHFPLQPPIGLQHLQMSGHTIAAPPLTRVVDAEAARVSVFTVKISLSFEMIHLHHVQVPTLSLADTKVATTVFVGNISEKATDTLVRQILLVS